ncbi:hypothetical protein B0I35DRAFT_13045 [Stachybotrys elegans]|uniref:Uncharacterized protein n=1 Tax=Stachybotrys elegans TaxID=80388 RepID=A0A8K0T0Z3_9HYPO|nr:hypothetical protein B0I35DRAFT_13045 [Stachybotrys elegans]
MGSWVPVGSQQPIPCHDLRLSDAIHLEGKCIVTWDKLVDRMAMIDRACATSRRCARLTGPVSYSNKNCRCMPIYPSPQRAECYSAHDSEPACAAHDHSFIHLLLKLGVATARHHKYCCALSSSLSDAGQDAERLKRSLAVATPERFPPSHPSRAPGLQQGPHALSGACITNPKVDMAWNIGPPAGDDTRFLHVEEEEGEDKARLRKTVASPIHDKTSGQPILHDNPYENGKVRASATPSHPGI